ncbi:MAG: phage tail protein [bacterium]|nr:phage tail protein [bacterium]
MSEPFIGQIQTYGFNFAPRGWALCDGQLLPISQNTALFSLLGTIYGGDGRTTFALPDLRGRAPIHFGNGPGLSTRKIGSRGGEQWVTLAVTQMPSHNHDATVGNIDLGTISAKLRCNTTESNTQAPEGNALANSNRNTYLNAAPDQDMHADSIEVTQSGTAGGTVTVYNNGGSQPHDNMQPYLTINYSIALVGLFPSRS